MTTVAVAYGTTMESLHRWSTRWVQWRMGSRHSIEWLLVTGPGIVIVATASVVIFFCKNEQDLVISEINKW